MTCIKRLVLIGFAGMAATLAPTQEDAQFEAEWQRMAELGREHQGERWSLKELSLNGSGRIRIAF